jgi:beta-lactamase superfamily II metal-dependent hydrolase
MTSSRLVILDVGHGNCAVLIDHGGTTVVDTGLGGTLIDFLMENKIGEVDYVLISHADSDHIAGLVGLLSIDEIAVRRIYLNPDSQRTSKLWEDLKSVLKEARNRGVAVFNGLSTSIPGEFKTGDATVQVLAPTPELALAGVGGTSIGGQAVSAHTLNAVIRVNVNERPLALILGDLDKNGLQEIKQENTNLNAEILVFPHHGGLSGDDPTDFARTLCGMVKPRVVVFSIGRGKHQTPRPEVVSALLKMDQKPHIACTQLSTWCAAKLPSGSSSHLASEAAAGREKNQCCAGSLVITSSAIQPLLHEHTLFVDKAAPTALCRNPALPIVKVSSPKDN